MLLIFTSEQLHGFNLYLVYQLIYIIYWNIQCILIGVNLNCYITLYFCNLFKNNVSSK